MPFTTFYFHKAPGLCDLTSRFRSFASRGGIEKQKIYEKKLLSTGCFMPSRFTGILKRVLTSSTRVA